MLNPLLLAALIQLHGLAPRLVLGQLLQLSQQVLHLLRQLLIKLLLLVHRGFLVLDKLRLRGDQNFLLG